MTTPFEGFSPETFDFLWGIRLNNNREWFTEHKGQYVQSLYEPMKALGRQLFEPFLELPGNILKVSRIYRDARLHHPDPYKESLWICIRRDVPWWGENPCLYFEIRPEGVSWGFFWWQPRTATLEQLRRDMAAEPGHFPDLVARTERAMGIPLTAREYKRPKPAPREDLARFYSWKGAIECTRSLEPGEDLFTPDLARRVARDFEALLPLYEFCNRYAV